MGRRQEGAAPGRAAPAGLSRMGQREVAGAGCSAQPRPGAGGPEDVAPWGHILGLSSPPLPELGSPFSLSLPLHREEISLVQL